MISGGGILFFLNGIRMTGAQIGQRFRQKAEDTKKAITLANKKASIVLYQWVMENFKDEGGPAGGWAPLAPSTVKWKSAHGYSKLLQNTGALRGSFVPYSDQDVALTGSPLAYSGYHQEGTGRMPQRRLLPNVAETQKIAVEIYGREMKVVTGRAL